MGYCGFCGKYLNDGEVCTCQGAQQNVYPTMGANAEQKASGNWNQEQNYGQSWSQNVNQNYGQTWNQNADQNTSQNYGQNLGQNYNQNWNQDLNQNNNQNWNQNQYGGQGWTPYNGQNQPPQQSPKRGAEGFAKYLQRLGFLDDGVYGEGAYEEDTDIVPDCLDLSDGETPVKQYTVAQMNNRVLGIPYERAVGKVQITNKRVIFRAPGKGIAGRTCQTHEFSVDELAGVTAQKRFIFQPWALFVSILCTVVGFVLYFLLSIAFRASGTEGTTIMFSIFGVLFGFGGLVPFFLVRKHWFLKLMAQGFSLGAFIMAAIWLGTIGRMGRLVEGAGAAKFFSVVFWIFTVLAGILLIITIIIGSMRPDLVLRLQGKTAVPAIDIHRKQFKSVGDVFAGYTEILPYKNVEDCIRELNAIIIDVQKLGDYAVEKWKKE